MPPVLRGEMLLDRMGGGQARLNYEQLRQDAIDLELQIKQLQVLDYLSKYTSCNTVFRTTSINHKKKYTT